MMGGSRSSGCPYAKSCALFGSSLNPIEYDLNQMGFKWALESSQTGIECPLNQMGFKWHD